MLFSIVVLTAACAPLVASASVPAFSKRGCSNETITGQETLENGVVLTKTKCHDEVAVKTGAVELGSKKRDSVFFICPNDTACSTTCYSGSGGPNQNDCTTIQNVILNNGNDIQIHEGNSWTYTWGSCEARFFNQVSRGDYTMDICPSAFAGTIEWLAGDCNGAHGAQGGLCLSETLGPDLNPIWFIDVIHS